MYEINVEREQDKILLHTLTVDNNSKLQQQTTVDLQKTG